MALVVHPEGGYEQRRSLKVSKVFHKKTTVVLDFWLEGSAQKHSITRVQ